MDEALSEHISRMEDGGFTLVLPNKKTGNNYDNFIPMDLVEKTSSRKKRKRRENVSDDFYNFQKNKK